MMPWVMVGLGLVILLLAGDALVKGAVNLSLRIGIPALIVSLTVVAFGTSAPELLISVNAVLAGKPGLALGNVVGSNTANVLMVLGIPALIAVMHTSACDCKRSYLQMLAASVLFIALAFRGTFDWIAGVILLGALALMLADAFRNAVTHRRAVAAAALLATEEDEVEGADPDMPWWQIITFLVLGLLGLPLGADIMVDNASILAMRYGVSEAAIGLTLVALGTSLPELATTVMAAIRRQADVALGNVIGSNMFNLLAIIGITALVAFADPVRDPVSRYRTALGGCLDNRLCRLCHARAGMNGNGK
jgi:cation:H+ antiporter